VQAQQIGGTLYRAARLPGQGRPNQSYVGPVRFAKR
jgi:hypothetical protein